MEELVTGVTGLAGITLDFSTPPENVPTVSEWGLVAMTLLVLGAGTMIFARRHYEKTGRNRFRESVRGRIGPLQGVDTRPDA